MAIFRVEDQMVIEALPRHIERSIEVLLTNQTLSRHDRQCIITNLEYALMELPQVEQPLEHAFLPGLYRRVITNPKGSLIVTKIHKASNFSFVLKGKIMVITDSDIKIVTAPDMFATHPCTQRIIYSIEDTIFVTVHSNPDNTTNLDDLESRIIAKSMDELIVEGAFV